MSLRMPCTSRGIHCCMRMSLEWSAPCLGSEVGMDMMRRFVKLMIRRGSTELLTLVRTNTSWHQGSFYLTKNSSLLSFQH